MEPAFPATKVSPFFVTVGQAYGYGEVVGEVYTQELCDTLAVAQLERLYPDTNTLEVLPTESEVSGELVCRVLSDQIRTNTPPDVVDERLLVTVSLNQTPFAAAEEQLLARANELSVPAVRPTDGVLYFTRTGGADGKPAGLSAVADVGSGPDSAAASQVSLTVDIRFRGSASFPELKALGLIDTMISAMDL